MHWVAQADPVDDVARVRAIERLSVLEGVWTERLQATVRTAQDAYRSEYAAITLVDRDVVRFSPRHGSVPKEVTRLETMRDVALSLHGGLLIGDARLDSRFQRLPGVVDGAVRYYAGQRIRDPQGVSVGTICVYDKDPRTVSLEDLAPLRSFASEVEQLIALAISDIQAGRESFGEPPNFSSAPEHEIPA